MVNDPWQHYFVGYGLLRQEGKVLLVGNRWRWNPSLSLVWTLPGGRAEEGESILDTLRREFCEETGLSPEVGPLLWVAEVFDTAKRHHFLSFVFSILTTEGNLDCSTDEYVVDVRFVEENALADYLAIPTFREPLLAHLGSPSEAPHYYLFGLGDPRSS